MGLSGVTDIPPTGVKIIRALRDEDLCERDLFIRLRPVDRLALHRFLPEMVERGWIAQYSKGREPAPVVEMFCLPGRQYQWA